MVHLWFDPENRLIRILPFYSTVVDATEGNDYVDVDAIDPNTPSYGWLALAKSRAYIAGTKNLASGYDFAADPRNFLIIAGDGVYAETITLDQTCSNAAEIASLINSKLQQTRFATEVEAITVDTDFVALQQKDPYWGDTFSFVLDYGDPDALTVLGINPGTYVGTSDIYEYSSWSGTRFQLKTALTRTYPTNIYCAAIYKEIQVQEIYDDAMDWADSDVGIAHSVPMEGAGYYPLGGGAYTDKIYVLKNNWKIMPHQGNYELTFIGTTITDDGSSRIRLPRSGIVSVVFQVSSQGIIATWPTQEVLDSIEQHDTDIKARLDTVDTEVGEVSTKVEAVDGKVDEVKEDLKKHDKKITGLVV